MKWPLILIFRLTSIIGVIAVYEYAPDTKAWYSIVYSLGFAHYLVSLIYSKQKIKEIYQTKVRVLPVFCLLIMSAGLYLYKFPLLIYFAVHHAFNEVYMLKSPLPAHHARITFLRGSSVLLHLFLYAVLLRNTSELAFVDPAVLFLALAFLYILYFLALKRLAYEINWVENFNYGAFEVVGLGLVVASFYVDFQFLHIVLYHFLLWSLLPIPILRVHNPASIPKYLVVMATATVLFLLASPIGLVRYELFYSLFMSQFLFWSYLHITVSFALSNAHPGWIIQLFRPQTVFGR